jgi:alpha-mannosidase
LRSHWLRAPLALALGMCLAAPARAHQDPGPTPDELAKRALPSTPEPAWGVPPPPAGAAAVNRPRFYLAMDDHTDYMWSGTDVQYRSAFGRMLDYYMNQAESTAYRPWDFRGRFTADGSFWVSEYAASHTPAQFLRLVSHLRDSSITMPLNTCVQNWGSMPVEAVLRSMYYAGRLERAASLRFSLVVPMENQVMPGGVASLWAGAGAKYAWKGICNCATCINAGNRSRDIYRLIGPDGTGVLMKWLPMYTNDTKMIGGYAEARSPSTVVNFMKTNAQYKADYPYDVHGAFGWGWDDFESENGIILSAAQTLSDANTRVIVSNELDFFREFDALYGTSVPTFGNAFGNEWDLGPGALSKPSSQVKVSIEKLRTAEALASVATLVTPTFMNPYTADRDSMDMSCGLYWEHSWGPGPGATQAQREAWQRQIQRAITRYVDTLQTRALTAVGAAVRKSTGAGERHVVFNSLAEVRTDFVDLSTSVAAPAHVVDLSTGLDLPSQSVTVGGQPRLRVLAGAVPSLGYRVLEVRPGAGTVFPNAATVNGATIDNAIVAITLGTRGQITSYVDHTDADRQLVTSGSAINDLGIGSGTVTLESSGPVSATLRVSTTGTLAHVTRVTLYSGLDRVEIENTLTTNFGDAEGYDSNFNLAGGAWRHEEVGMIARAAYASAGGDYANQNSRTDYLTNNHFVDLSTATRGVTMSVWDGMFFQLGNSTYTLLDATSTRVSAMIGFQVDCFTNFNNQGGDTNFLNRYALHTHGVWDGPSAMRFALEHQNPLVETRVTGTTTSALSETSWSMLSSSDANVLVWGVKPAEDGPSQGLVMRAWNLSSAVRTPSLAFGLTLSDARQVTHIETDIGTAGRSGNAIVESIPSMQLRSWRVLPAETLTVPVVPQPPASLLFAVYPSPARLGAARTVEFVLPVADRVRITLHDVSGARVATLADGPYDAGPHQFTWQPAGVKPGIYFVRLEVGGHRASRRIAVL